MTVASAQRLVMTEQLLDDRYRFVGGSPPAHLTGAQREAWQSFLNEIDAKARYVELEACPYCGGRECLKISEVEQRGLPAALAICLSCQGCFKARILDPEANAYYYTHLSYALRGKGLSESQIEQLFWRRVSEVASPRCQFIRHFLDLRPGRDLIVEFGCNDGANLYPWHKAGFEVLGVDVDRRVVAFGQRQGLRLVCGDFLRYDVSALKGPRLMILSHVLEHVFDLHKALEHLSRATGPEGAVFIEVPGIRVQGFGNPLQYFDVEHNFNFDLGSLSRVLRAHGFRTLYADEFIRAICAPEQSQVRLVKRPVPWSVRQLTAAVLRPCVNRLDRQPKRLYPFLAEGDSRSLKARVANRLRAAYFDAYYAAMSEPAHSHGRSPS